MAKEALKSHQNKSETLLICGLLRCHISTGCDELRVRNSWAMCTPAVPFWRLGIDRAGTWWSMLVNVEYVISWRAWMAFRTSMLSVATSVRNFKIYDNFYVTCFRHLPWWSVDTWVSRRSTEFRMFGGFSSFITSFSSSSSSEMLSGIMLALLLLFMLTGLLFALGVRDFWDFSLSAMRVCRLQKSLTRLIFHPSKMKQKLTFVKVSHVARDLQRKRHEWVIS